MSNKFLMVFALCTSFLGGCATLAPPEVRRVEFIQDTKVSKALAFKRAHVHFAKQFGDSNKTIKLQDQDAGQIVAKGLTQCLALRSWGDFINDYKLDFTLDFTAKDNKVRLVFEDLVMLDDKLTPLGGAHLQLTDAAKVEKVKGECLAPIKDGLLKAIEADSGDKW